MKNSKYTKKQILEALKHWKGVLETMTNEAKDDSDVPVISSIGEFLDICKDRGLEVEKKVADKQGKVVNARLATRDEKIMSREGEEIAKKGCLVIDDGDNTFYAVQPDDISKYYEVDAEGNSATGDNKKWKKIGKRLDYYVTPFDVDIKVSWQDSPLHATAGYSLVCNDKEGKDISPVAPEVFKDKTLWRIAEESCKAKKINESLIPFDRDGLSRSLNNIVSRLDESTKKKFEHEIAILESLIEDLDPKLTTDIPLSNQIAQVAVSLLESFLDYQIENARMTEVEKDDFSEQPFNVGDILWDTYNGEELEPVKVKRVINNQDGTLSYECFIFGNRTKILDHFALKPLKVAV